MFTSKVLKSFMFALTVLMLSACGGGGSSTSSDANTTTAPTAQALAIQAIATYAQDGGTAPSVEVYATAEVSGIDATNLDAANTLVESLVYEDVDTVEEIQALVDSLNANTAPVATAQSITLDEDTSKTITFAGTDADGDALSYTVKTQPSHGTITGNTYTPNPNYFGNDSFGFMANDGTVDSAEATVSITVTAVNDAPVATAQTLTTAEDTAKAFTLRATDVEDDALSYRVTTQPTHGTISGNNMYTPNANYFGSDSFAFVANDGTVDSAEATISITVTAVNDAPIATAQTLTTTEDTAKVFTFAGTDVDGDALSYTVTTQPTHGTIVNNMYTPNANYFGSDSFAFVANDGTIDSSEATVIITITSVFDPFITTWKTDNEGNTTDTQIKIGTRPFDGNISSDYYFPHRYNFTIEWGDGSKDENITSEIIHTYEEIGTYSIKISGKYPQPWFGNYGPQRNYKDYDGHKLLSIDQWGDTEWKSMVAAFIECRRMIGNAADKPNLTDVHSMFRMFYRAGDFNQNIDNWDVSNVTNMSAMFKYAYNFNQNIDNWDVSSVTDMSAMFRHAFDFNQNIDNWDVSNVTNMSSMFSRARTFNQDLSAWDVSAVTDMSAMFSRTSAFNQDLSTWDVSAVTDMYQMFSRTSAFNQDLSAWDVSSVTNIGTMFLGATAFNQDLSTWDVSSVTYMSNVFSGATTFNQDLSSWDVSAVKNMGLMFRGVTLSTANYDALLLGWSALSLQSGVTFSGGDSQYSATSQAARDTLTNDYNWTVTDGGVAP